MAGFTSTRLTVARERRGMSARDLAEACGVSTQTIYNWESGERAPTAENLSRAAHVLRFREDYFSRGPLEVLPAGAATFRARTTLGARDRGTALAAGTMALEFARWIEARFQLPGVQIPDLSDTTPEIAAAVVRQEWMLGHKPIPNMIHLLESRGVLVLALAQDCLEIDAFSFWMGGRPIVMLNTQKSAERSTLDAAHELAHLVLHREETGKKEEGEADQFAGRFLMPDGDLREQVPAFQSLQHLLAVKRRWGVSLAALVYRLHAAGVLTDWQYRTLFIAISKNQWRKQEPNPMERRGSALLPKVFTALKDQGISPRRIASDLGWSVGDLNDLVFGMGASWTSIDGDGDRSGSSRAALRLVPR